MATQTTTPFLDLTSTADRPTVRTNSGTFELRTHRDLTVEEFQQFERHSAQMGLLLQITDRTAAQVAERLQHTNRLCCIGLGVGLEVVEQFCDVERTAIADFFTALLSPVLLNLNQAREALVNPRNGASSFPGSPDTTEAPPAPGSETRPSA